MPVKEEVKFFRVERRAYFVENGEIVLQEEIKREPELYFGSLNEKVRRLAEEKRRLTRKEKEGRDYDYGFSP